MCPAAFCHFLNKSEQFEVLTYSSAICVSFSSNCPSSLVVRFPCKCRDMSERPITSFCSSAKPRQMRGVVQSKSRELPVAPTPYLRRDYDTSRTGSLVVPAAPLRRRYLKRTVICRDILHAHPFTVCRYYITNKDFVQPINNGLSVFTLCS